MGFVKAVASNVIPREHLGAAYVEKLELSS